MDLQLLWDKLIKHYGDELPDPEQQPKQFRYYVKLFLYTENANPRADYAPQANS